MGGSILELAVNPLRRKFCPIKDQVTIPSNFWSRGPGWWTLAAASENETNRGGSARSWPQGLKRRQWQRIQRAMRQIEGRERLLELTANPAGSGYSLVGSREGA